MKKRIFFVSIVVTFVGIIIFAIITTDIYYKSTVEYAKDNLVVYMNQYDDSYSSDYEGAKALSDKLDGARVTIMLLDGTVLGDSSGNVTENHSNREEVITAIQDGFGYSVRSSDTIGEKSIYYCEKFQDNGLLVRISIPTTSSIGIFAKSIPTIIWFLCFDLLLCAIISFALVDVILKPVEEIARKSALGEPVKTDYTELDSLTNIINNNQKIIGEKIENIKESKRIESLVLNNMEHGIIILSNNDDIVLINNSASNLLKCKPDEKKVSYFINDDEIKEMLSGKKDSLVYRTFNNKEYAIRYTYTDESKVILMTDFTEIRRVEKSKNDFIANVTHEMNTPLTSIKGFAEMISNELLTKDKTKHAGEVILKQTNRLSLLIKDIINYSAIQSDSLPSYEVNISEICKSVLASLETLLYDKGIEVTTNIYNDIKIKSRNERVIEIVTNLITNAIKYNKNNGKIEVSLYKEKDKTYFKVSDTGIGIAEENREKIFDRFFTVDKSHNEHLSGFGLGLAIVKKIVRQSDWEITLDSKLNEGTTFTIIMK